MKALGRILGILLLLAIVVVGAGFFLLPKMATKSETIAIQKPAATVFALLANTPAAGEKFGVGPEAVTETLKTATPPDTVVFDVTYADGGKGSATYKVAADGEKSSKVSVTISKPLGDSPSDRIGALTGTPAEPFLAAAKLQLVSDTSLLNGEPLAGLAYQVVTVDAEPFVYGEGESKQDAAEIKEAVAQILQVVDVIIKSKNVRTVGNPIAVETEWNEAKKTYDFEAGWRITGTPPKIYLKDVHADTLPGGTAIKVAYKGPEENVLPTYDKMEDLVRAAHLPLGRSFEVYNDDPTKPGGSVDREIYYMVTGNAADVTAALAKILPPQSDDALAGAPALTMPPAASAAPAATAAPAASATPQ
jgi:effector-binding domain-containing protein